MPIRHRGSFNPMPVRCHTRRSPQRKVTGQKLEGQFSLPCSASPTQESCFFEPATYQTCVGNTTADLALFPNRSKRKYYAGNRHWPCLKSCPKKNKHTTAKPMNEHAASIIKIARCHHVSTPPTHSSHSQRAQSRITKRRRKKKSQHRTSR